MSVDINLSSIIQAIGGIVITFGGFFIRRLLGELETAVKKLDAVSEKFAGHEVRITVLEEQNERTEARLDRIEERH